MSFGFREGQLKSAVKAVAALRDTHPWIDLQGLDDAECEVVARAVLHAVFPVVPEWRPQGDERVKESGADR